MTPNNNIYEHRITAFGNTYIVSISPVGMVSVTCLGYSDIYEGIIRVGTANANYSREFEDRFIPVGL